MHHSRENHVPGDGAVVDGKPNIGASHVSALHINIRLIILPMEPTANIVRPGEPFAMRRRRSASCAARGRVVR
jgi:hypothetical protein